MSRAHALAMQAMQPLAGFAIAEAAEAARRAWPDDHPARIRERALPPAERDEALARAWFHHKAQQTPALDRFDFTRFDKEAKP